MEQMIAVRQARDDLGRTRRFRYYLLTEQAGGPRFWCESYGVRILEEGGGDAAVPDLTTDPAAMDELMTLLVDGLVGPVGLEDVVRDWAEENLTDGRAGPIFAGASPAGR